MDAWKVNYEECQVQSLWLAYKFKGFCKKSNFKIKCVLWYLAKKKKNQYASKFKGLFQKHMLHPTMKDYYHVVLICLKHKGRNVTLKWNMQYLEKK